MKVSKYLSLSEVACKCGCGQIPQKVMLDKFDQIREAYGKPIHITSGFRCEKHNKKIGGSKNSNHVKGLAIDVLRLKELTDFILKNLETLDMYIEDPAVTVSWIHISPVPPKSGKRIFKP
jgi:hypothetical protein